MGRDPILQTIEIQRGAAKLTTHTHTHTHAIRFPPLSLPPYKRLSNEKKYRTKERPQQKITLINLTR